MSDQQPTTPDPSGVARTPTGEISSPTTPPEATTPQTSTTPTETPSVINQPSGSLANQAPAVPSTGAPDIYQQFNVPSGYELDPKILEEATGLFKGAGLTQDHAQKLVDFYVAKTTESQNEPFRFWQETQENWVKEVKADPELGHRLDQVKTTISRAIDSLNDPKLAQAFREAMDYTGAGNNPAFIRAFYKLSQKLTEGNFVSGNGPSAPSQQRQGTMPSAAKAMYPNLP